MRVLTAAEIRGLESCAVESGVSMETLMENAGAAVAAAVTEKMDVTGKKTVILCGKGNNGGDGFVAARLLAAEGAKVTVVLMQGAPASDLAKQAYDKMGRGIEIIMVPHGGRRGRRGGRHHRCGVRLQLSRPSAERDGAFVCACSGK